MTDLDELEWSKPVDDPTRPERNPRGCRKHEWTVPFVYEDLTRAWYCGRCGKRKDVAASRRGRTSLRAGKDAERAIAKAYPGGKRTGHFGGPDDVLVGDLFIIQSKAGGWFSERVWNELEKLPRVGGRVPTLVVSDRPGPGHRTRRYVIRSMEDDVDLHGQVVKP